MECFPNRLNVCCTSSLCTACPTCWRDKSVCAWDPCRPVGSATGCMRKSVQSTMSCWRHRLYKDGLRIRFTKERCTEYIGVATKQGPHAGRGRGVSGVTSMTNKPWRPLDRCSGESEASQWPAHARALLAVGVVPSFLAHNQQRVFISDSLGYKLQRDC